MVPAQRDLADHPSRREEPPAAGDTLSDASDYLSRVGTAAVVSFVVTELATLLLTGMVIAVIG